MNADYMKNLDERQRRLIKNCVNYRDGDPAGLPGHNLMIIIAEMHDAIVQQEKLADRFLDRSLGLE